MEILVFTLNAMVIYLVADRLLTFIEKRRGTPIMQRQVVFMGVFLVLILVSFELLNRFFGA